MSETTLQSKPIPVSQTAQSVSQTCILDTLRCIVPDRECIEMRGQNHKGFWWSGFYDKNHLEKLAHDAVVMDAQSKGIYLTLNTTNPALLSRRSNRIETYGIKDKEMTSDKDVTNWDYLPIDIDPNRPSGISSTKEELDAAYDVAERVIAYLFEYGFGKPLVACSGNGWHLLYKIDLPRSDENDGIVKKILYALSKKFDTDNVGVDVSNNNPSRIFKLYGTMARKGENTPERPYRLSYIHTIPDAFKPVAPANLLSFIKAHKESCNASGKAGGKASKRLKNPDDVTARHPEFLKVVGKMVHSNFPLDAIIAACEKVNAGFKEPKPQDVLIPEIKKIYEFCIERQKDIDDLPEYVHPVIDEKSGEIVGYSLDYVKYSDYLHEKFSTVFFNDRIYVYDDTNHIYKQSANEIQTLVRDTLIEYDIPAKLTKTIPEILLHLKAMGGYTEYPFNFSHDTLPVKNGILKIHRNRVKIENGRANLKTCIELLPHGKEHLFTFILNADYDPDVDTEKVMGLFNQWVTTEKDVVKLLQAPAQGLVQMQTRHSHKKAYLIQGEANSGKTSYFKLLITLFTPEYVSAASLQDLCEDKFVGSELEGKIINIKDDLQALLLKTCEQFKEITGDCSIGVERKYEKKYRGWATATLLFSCNYPPRCNEQIKKDGAYWARFEYIKFPNTFPTNHRFYEETYTPEFLSAFLNALLDVVVKIHHTGALLEVSEPGEVLMNWSADADPIQNFVEDTFVDTQDVHDYSKPKMFAEYQKWYRETIGDEKRMIISEKAFTTAIQPYFVVAEQRLPKDETGKREHVRIYRSNKAKLDPKMDLVPEREQQTL